MNLTIFIIIIYLIIMFLFGFLIKKAKNEEEYSTANQTLGIISVVAGLVMTLFGAGFILGGAELGYKYGWYGLVYGWAAGFGLLLLGLFSNKIYNEMQVSKIKTIPSLLYNKFKSRKISYMSAILSIVALTAITSAQLFAATRIFTALDISIKGSLVITVVIVMLVASKGINAITKFGKYNLIIASIGALAAILLASKIPVSAELVNNGFQSISMSSLLWLIIPTSLYIVVGQDLHQKLYSSKNKKTIKISCMIAGIILILLSFFPVFIGIKSNSLFAIEPTESVPRFIIYSMPSIFKGLFIAAILAAVIGCAQSVINAASTQVTEDLFKPTGKFSDKQLGKISSLSAVSLSLIAFVIALFSTSIINNLIIAYSIYTAGMFIPVMLAFYAKKPRRIAGSVFVASIFGAITALVFELIIKIAVPSIVLGVGGSFLILVVLLFRV